jgi:hypothetical protein
MHICSPNFSQIYGNPQQQIYRFLRSVFVPRNILDFLSCKSYPDLRGRAYRLEPG